MQFEVIKRQTIPLNPNKNYITTQHRQQYENYFNVYKKIEDDEENYIMDKKIWGWNFGGFWGIFVVIPKCLGVVDGYCGFYKKKS